MFFSSAANLAPLGGNNFSLEGRFPLMERKLTTMEGKFAPKGGKLAAKGANFPLLKKNVAPATEKPHYMSIN